MTAKFRRFLSSLCYRSEQTWSSIFLFWLILLVVVSICTFLFPMSIRSNVQIVNVEFVSPRLIYCASGVRKLCCNQVRFFCLSMAVQDVWDLVMTANRLQNVERGSVLGECCRNLQILRSRKCFLLRFSINFFLPTIACFLKLRGFFCPRCEAHDVLPAHRSSSDINVVR